MVSYRILLDDKAAEFYTKVAAKADRTTETVLADALFKLAGELSLEAISKRRSCGRLEQTRSGNDS